MNYSNHKIKLVLLTAALNIACGVKLNACDEAPFTFHAVNSEANQGFIPTASTANISNTAPEPVIGCPPAILKSADTYKPLIEETTLLLKSGAYKKAIESCLKAIVSIDSNNQPALAESERIPEHFKAVIYTNLALAYFYSADISKATEKAKEGKGYCEVHLAYLASSEVALSTIKREYVNLCKILSRCLSDHSQERHFTGSPVAAITTTTAAQRQQQHLQAQFEQQVIAMRNKIHLQYQQKVEEFVQRQQARQTTIVAGYERKFQQMAQRINELEEEREILREELSAPVANSNVMKRGRDEGDSTDEPDAKRLRIV